MQENKNLLLVAGGLFLILMTVFFGKDLIIKKITKEVVQQLKRDYVPGPYNPGFDPDKVDPNLLRASN